MSWIAEHYRTLTGIIFVIAFALMVLRSGSPGNRYKPFMNVLFDIAVFAIAVLLTIVLRKAAYGY